jgi:hypothetical protein
LFLMSFSTKNNQKSLEKWLSLQMGWKYMG